MNVMRWETSVGRRENRPRLVRVLVYYKSTYIEIEGNFDIQTECKSDALSHL